MFEEPREKCLGQILSVVRTVPVPANVCVEGIPVRAGERFKCGCGLR
jgi:hypothetical protein